MNRPFHLFLVLLSPAVLAVAGCDGQVKTAPKTSAVSANKTSKAFKEGSDYFLFERVRILDKTAFAKPEEAYSILLRKDGNTKAILFGINQDNMCRNFSVDKSSIA
jgi:hypothetical protein